MDAASRPQVTHSPFELLQQFLNFNGLSLAEVMGIITKGPKMTFDPNRVTDIRNLTAQERVEQSVGVMPACAVTHDGKKFIVRVVQSSLLGIINRRFVRIDGFQSVEHLSMTGGPSGDERSLDDTAHHTTAANPSRMRFVYDLPIPGMSRPVNK